MKINLNAYRNSGGDTDVIIQFTEIFNDCFKLVATQKIVDSNNTQEAVIFHFKNEKGARMENSGNDNLVFSENFKLKTNYIRVFYLNDSEDLSDSLDCFIKFLDDYGLRENAPEEVYCPYPNPKEKAIAIPRQAGNGGVVGIVNIP
jgi:hypothetical protein